MQNKDKCNYISIAKALGIILMVIGHSGCPTVFIRFLYLFHMPLFFLCSGYFFKEMKQISSLKAFSIRKIKGLYIPYMKWSLLFILLHNPFYLLNIYNSYTNTYPYNTIDYGKSLLKAAFMTDYELLVRPFWFIKELLFSSIFIAVISLLRIKVYKSLNHGILFSLLLITTIAFKWVNPTLPIIGNCSILALCAVYFYTGIIFRNIENFIPVNISTTSIAFLVTFIGSLLYKGDIDMRYTTIQNIVPYYMLSLFGIIMTFNISKWLDRSQIKCLYYIGNHTMPILALNLFAFKLGSLIKIYYYNMPIEKLSSYTVINENNFYFWVVYTIIGITIPLLTEYIFNKITQKKQIIMRFFGNKQN